MIYNLEPIQALWDICKSLLFNADGSVKTDGIPIYKEIMAEDDNSVPKSYILLRSQISDTTDLFGDGKGLIRSADCDIILVTKGHADDTTDIHNVNKAKIRKVLNEKSVSFSEFNLGYVDASKSTEHTFSTNVKYIV